MNLSIFLVTILFLPFVYVTNITLIKIDAQVFGLPLKHFWKSTGMCPPDPKNEVYKFLLSKDEKLNFVYIGAMPNKGIKYVRIHWLLNLIQIRHFNGVPEYDFTYLDSLLDWIKTQELYVGFELMGTPMINNNNRSSLTNNVNWYNCIFNLTKRYVDKYGINYVKKWRFETWNEPDLKNYNLLNFTIEEYVSYVKACKNALEDALFTTSSRLKYGGPAGLFKDPKKHPLCWGLLKECNDDIKNCPINYLSFHKKGNGTSTRILNDTLQLLNLIYSKYPKLRKLPIANDEADILTNWSKSEEWRGDVRYAAMMVQVIIDYYKKLNVELKMEIEVLSNDNGFLNYYPDYFTQRTLLTRFQMNRTNPPYTQFIKKPSYSVMALLSLLGDEYLTSEKIISPDPSVSFLASRSYKNTNTTQSLSLLISYANNTQICNEMNKRMRINFYNLPNFEFKYVVYILDNLKTNPYMIWKDAGSPVFPKRRLRAKMRKVEEPFRLIGPTAVRYSFNLDISLSLPSVALVHVCGQNYQSPGRVTHLKIYNVTKGEVLLVWKDTKVNTKCILTYEVEFQPERNENFSEVFEFKRINRHDTMFLSYHYSNTTGRSSREATRGRYRVRALDYWNIPGKYSKCINYPTI